MTFHFWYAFAKAIITLPDPLAREQRIVQFRPAYGQLIEHLRGPLLNALLVCVATFNYDASLPAPPSQHCDSILINELPSAVLLTIFCGLVVSQSVVMMFPPDFERWPEDVQEDHKHFR